MASIVFFAKKSIHYLRDVDNVFKILKLMFHHIGLWPRLKESSIIPANPFIQKWCPRFLLAVSTYFTLISTPLASYASRNELIVDILEPLAFAFMTSMNVIYVSSLLYRGERFEQVFSTLSEMRACAALYPRRPKSIKARAQLYKDLVLVYGVQILGALAGFVLLGFPILIKSRKFLFGSWYPYNATQSPYFELTTLVWLVYIVISVIILNAINVLLMYLYAQAIAHMWLLRFTLENIKPLSVKALKKRTGAYKPNTNDQAESALFTSRRGSDGGSFRRSYFNEMLLNREMEKIIRLCSRHHQIINKFVDEISSAFGIILAQQLNCCLFPTAMSIVLVVYTPEISFKIFMFIGMTSAAFANLFLYCWLAQEVAMESSQVCDAVYSCDWLDASNSFKRSMLVIMVRCNQPLVSTVAGLFPLDVNLCITMIKMTYSYYMSVVETLEIKRAAAASNDKLAITTISD